MTPADYLQRFLHWLALEGAAELEQQRQLSAGDALQAERRGVCLTGLAIRDEDVGLAGRYIITLAKRDQRLSLPWTRLSPGTPVVLQEEAVRDAELWRGTVSARDSSSIEIALNSLPEPQADRPLWRLQLSTDEVSRQRQLDALSKAMKAERGRLKQLREVLLGERPPRFRTAGDWQPKDPQINAAQREAIDHALAAEDVAIVHGPPGTGKTRTIVELIRQAVAREQKVLACAPSNLAVDNLVERLDAAGVRVLRLGHPARVLTHLQSLTLDVLVDEHPDVAVARKLLKEASVLKDRAARFTRGKPAPGYKQQLRQEAAEMKADAIRIEQQLVAHLIDSAEVICGTLTGLSADLLGSRQFDLLVIDEASQATEPACWPAITRAERVVFAGDHCQLPPTVLSQPAAKEGLATSMMERLIFSAGNDLARQLVVQHRMHQQIMAFSSTEFYRGTLTAHASVASHTLAEIIPPRDEPLFQCPVEFIDTAGAGFDEEAEADGQSLNNPREAALAANKVKQLLEAGLSANDVAIIAPYAAQVRYLERLLLDAGVEIDTVDGFQGREKEAIILTLVRSNNTGEIGFLGELRRMNVALTRAKRKLLIIGDSATLGGHEFYQRLLAHAEACGGYRSVWEETLD